jgi:glycosyltransferase involved in cell wall biosynthesis
MSSASRFSGENSIALAYVGCVVPDEPAYQSSAFSRAGNMFQTNLLAAIQSAGLPVSAIITPIPIRSWPAGKNLVAGNVSYQLFGNHKVRSLSFLNIPVLKQLTIGAGAFLRLLLWGWQNRNCPARVVATYNLTVPPGLFTLAAARLIGAKVFALIYDVNIPGETVPDSLFFRADYQFHRWLMPRFDGLAVVSEAIVRDFGLRAPHILLEGGFDESVFASLPLAREEQPTFVIVSVGTLNYANGFRLLLDAFAKLKGDRYTLRIAGVGPLENEVRAAAAADSRIDYRGYLSLSEVLDLYQTADLLVNLRLTQKVNTTYFFPSKVMEYLASGRPLLSTCTGHIEREFGRFTYLLREESPDALASAIIDVESAGYAARNRQGSIARDYMLANKTWAAQGRRLVEFIRSLAWSDAERN